MRPVKKWAIKHAVIGFIASEGTRGERETEHVFVREVGGGQEKDKMRTFMLQIMSKKTNTINNDKAFTELSVYVLLLLKLPWQTFMCKCCLFVWIWFLNKSIQLKWFISMHSFAGKVMQRTQKAYSRLINNLRKYKKTATLQQKDNVYHSKKKNLPVIVYMCNASICISCLF